MSALEDPARPPSIEIARAGNRVTNSNKGGEVPSDRVVYRRWIGLGNGLAGSMDLSGQDSRRGLPYRGPRHVLRAPLVYPKRDPRERTELVRRKIVRHSSRPHRVLRAQRPGEMPVPLMHANDYVLTDTTSD
jgi:hypothetical protein